MKVTLKVLMLLACLIGTITVYAAQQPPSEQSPSLAATVDVVDVRLVRDADFYGNQDWTKRNSLPRQDVGGRLQVHIKNNSASPLAITGYKLGGKSFSELTTQKTTSPTVSDSKWTRTWPNPIPSGKTGTVTIRMVDLEADLGDSFELETDQGSFTLSPFNPQASPLWIPSLNFSADLNRTVLFVANRGSSNVTLPADGGVSIDGVAFAGTLPETTLQPGDVVPITLEGTASVLSVGTHAIFVVKASGGATTASGGLRVFPYHFTMQSHMQGSNFDEQDRESYFIGDWDYWVPEIIDEPSGKGWTPMDVVDAVDDWLEGDDEQERQERADRPVTVHNTSYMEGLVYDDIADIPNSHWGNVRQDLSTFLTWPKANWYMPQNTWGQNEGLYRRESWYPLEDIHFQAFEAVGHGAKSIQWFLYQNHWRQGWGRMEGTDFGRVYQDKYRTGHNGNPLTWSRIGRVSGALAMLQPYLNNSAVYQNTRTDTGIEINTLISANHTIDGTYKAVAILMDHRTPRTSHTSGHLFRYAVPAWNQQVLYDQHVSITVPAYVYSLISTAYAIDPWLGIQELPIQKTDPDTIALTVPEIQTGALIVLGNASDGTALQSAWNSVQSSFDSYDDVRPAMLARAHQNPTTSWQAPNATYRQEVTVTNDGTSDAAVLSVPVDMQVEREYRSEDVRVFEIQGNQSTEVPFLLEGTKVYETYTTNPLDRMAGNCQGSTSPDGCDFSFELDPEGGIAIKSAYKKAGYDWYAGIETEAQAIPWMTDEGYPSRWIPARYKTFAVDVDLSNLPWWWLARVVFYIDNDSDGEIDHNRGFQVEADSAVRYDLGNGWMRYIFDMNDIYGHWDEEPAGQYRPAFLTQVLPNWSFAEGETFHMSVRQIQVSSREALLKPATPLAPGETRTYEIYFDVRENTRSVLADTFDPSLSTAEPASNVTVAAQPVQVAGVSVSIDQQNVTISTQSPVKNVLVRHLGSDGTIVWAETLSSATDTQTFQATLTRQLLRGEVLACIPIQLGKEGQVFTFNSSGMPISGHVPQDTTIKENWSQPILSTYEEPEPTGRYPFSVDMSDNGEHVAMGLAKINYEYLDDGRIVDHFDKGMLHVYNSSGGVAWEKEYEGRVFHVRFTLDSQSLYVAVNLEEDQIEPDANFVFKLYENSHIIKYDAATGDEQWRHKVGSGVSGIAGDAQGRTVFDMDVYPNGDVLYSEWNSYGVKLNGQDGTVIWGEPTNGGSKTYAPDVTALADGGALVHGFYAKHIKPDGTTRNHVFVSNEQAFSIDGSSDGSVWAFTGKELRIMKNLPDGINYRISGEGSNMETLPSGTYIGRYPRIIRVSADGQYVAAGTSDGRFVLLDSSGSILWDTKNGASYITDIQFLSDASGATAGVAFARELFDYQHDNYKEANRRNGWRFRDVVEAYTLDGTERWRHEGPWRENRWSEPFMNQFVVNSDETRLAVLTNEAVRYVDLTAQEQSNSYLYPVEDPFGDGEDIPPPANATPTPTIQPEQPTATPTGAPIEWTPTPTPIPAPDPDKFESDDTNDNANLIATDGSIQEHTFHVQNNADWVYFEANATDTTKYLIEAQVPPGSNADVVLEVYADSTSQNAIVAQGYDYTNQARIIFDASSDEDKRIYMKLMTEEDTPILDRASYYLSVRALPDTSGDALIIVAGRADDIYSQGPAQTIINAVADEVQTRFQASGYSQEQIYYMDSYTDETYNPPLKPFVKSAITDWGERHTGNNGMLTVYIIGSGREGELLLNKPGQPAEAMTPDDLDGWLQELETARSDIRINVILEAPYAGSFLNAAALLQSLEGDGRTVIASTGAQAGAMASNTGAFFSDHLLTQLATGSSFSNSFNAATWALDLTYPWQVPMLSGEADAQLRGLAPDDTVWPPMITQAEADLEQDTIRANVQTQDGGAVQVWATIHQQTEQAQTGTDFAEGVYVPLHADANNPGWYEVSHTFMDTDDHIVIHVEDAAGLVAQPVQVILERAGVILPTPTPTPVPPLAGDDASLVYLPLIRK